MEKILEELDNFVLDEDKLVYLTKNKIDLFVSSAQMLYQLCSEFIFDCNRNQMINLISFDPELKINESILYDILKLYIFDFERNIVFLHLKFYVEPIQNIESFEKLYTYSNEKYIFLSINSSPKEFVDKKQEYSNESEPIKLKVKKNKLSSCAH